METHPQKNSFGDMFLRTVAVLGLIAVLLLGAWGIIQLAVSIPSIFANLGGRVSTTLTSIKKESLTVSAAPSITSGQTLAVSWAHANKDGEYSYALSFACASGVSLKAPAPNGSYQTVACNTPFNFVKATEHMNVIPSGSGALALTVSATKLSSGAVTTSGSATTNVAKAAAAVATTKGTQTTTAVKGVVTKGVVTSVDKNTTYTYYPVTTVPQLYGLPDLAVQVLSVTPGQNGQVVVQFSITNVGTNSAPGGWTFNANLPINGSYMFTSQVQRALFPGDKVVYNLSFSRTPNYYTQNYNNYNQYPYDNSGWGYTCTNYGCSNYTQPTYPTYTTGYVGGTATITADSANYIYEYSEGNNFVSVAIPSN